jgi:acyl-CoA thioester hydrolase
MAEYRFFHPVQVRYGDLDPQGHVNNAKHLTFFEQARVQYLIELGLSTKDQSFMDIGVILADVQITYLKPIRFGQEIEVGVRTARLGNKSMTMEQNIVDVESGEELATGELVLVTYDYHDKKSIPVPAEWRKKLQEFDRIVV